MSKIMVMINACRWVTETKIHRSNFVKRSVTTSWIVRPKNSHTIDSVGYRPFWRKIIYSFIFLKMFNRPWGADIVSAASAGTSAIRKIFELSSIVESRPVRAQELWSKYLMNLYKTRFYRKLKIVNFFRKWVFTDNKWIH